MTPAGRTPDMSTDRTWFVPTGWTTAHLLRDVRRIQSGSQKAVTVCGREAGSPITSAQPDERRCGQCSRRFVPAPVRHADGEDTRHG